MSSRTRRAINLFALGLFLVGAPASAQNFTSPASPPPVIMSYAKPADAPASPPSLTVHYSKPAEAPVTIPEGEGPNLSSAKETRPSAPVARAPARRYPGSAPGPVRAGAMVQQGNPPPEGGLTEGLPTDLNPPSREKLFHLATEEELYEQIRQDNRATEPKTVPFPEEPVLSKNRFVGSVPRHFPATAEVVEPHYLCYQRLLFEDKNSERFGWDLGIVQPLVSSGIYFYDLLTLPYHLFTRPCERFECSAGYCLPGDPVPYLIYPEECSWTGAVAEVGTVVALFAIFP
jgi:hypothetical protein